MRNVVFVERYEKQPYFRVLIDNEIVYQSLSKKRAYAFYLSVLEAIRKEKQDETGQQV